MKKGQAQGQWPSALIQGKGEVMSGLPFLPTMPAGSEKAVRWTWSVSTLFCVNIQENRLGRSKAEASRVHLEVKTGDQDMGSRVAPRREREKQPNLPGDKAGAGT